MTALNILAGGLILAAVLPLLLVGVLALASYFNLAIADRLLDGLAASLIVQWVMGCVLNLAGGLALVALGIWLPTHAPTLTNMLIGLVTVPFGFWRMRRGFVGFPRKS